MLRDANVGEAPASSGEAGVGSQVTVAYGGDDDDTETFLIGAREMLGLDADIDTQVYSPQSPLGQAVIGAKIGSQVSYVAPNGRTIELKILDVKPFGG